MLDDIAWPPPPWAAVTFLVPAVLVFLLAIWVWHARARHTSVVAALLAVAVHPPLLLAVAPLLTPRRGKPDTGTATLVRLAVVVSGSAALLQLAPECRIDRAASATIVTAGIVRMLGASVGIIAGLLALVETVRAPTAPHTRAALLVIVCSVIAVFAFQRFDARVTLLPAAASLWWLAAAAVAALIAARPSTVSRMGAALVLGLVPTLQAWQAAASLPSRSGEARTTAAAVVDALDTMRVPARLVTEDPAHDWLATVWAAGHDRRGRLFEIVAQPGVTQSEKTLYAFAGGTRRLIARGFLTGPVASGVGPPEAILWRALSNERCEWMRPEWIDLSPLVTNGQITGVFEQGATGRHAVMWAALPQPATIDAIGWPQMALPGLRLRGFNLTNPQERRQYFEAALGDDLPLTLLPSDAAFVARVVLGRMEGTPGTLAIAFERLPVRVVGRLDTGASTDRLELCGSAQDLAVVGYADAPAVAPFTVASPAVIGAGWSAVEREGEVRFRSMAAPEAELRFVAAAAEQLSLEFDVLNQPGQTLEPDEVLLNGLPARCERRDSSCTWILPVEAVKTGLNTIQLRARATLRISGARLRSPSVLRRR